MTIDYIRGFFDGEGCVGYTEKGGVFTWKEVRIDNTNKQLIDKISQKLTELKIKHHRGSSERNQKSCYKKIWSIRIAQTLDIYTFYQIIGTSHKTKEEKFKYIFKHSEKLKRWKKVSKVKELIGQDFTYQEIANKMDISPSTVCRMNQGKKYFNYTIPTKER
ncbi:LAGLIDADG family homing endonuclease [bacterium]|nr:LAGLIDADG family homing endonuclease [bacterium]